MNSMAFVSKTSTSLGWARLAQFGVARSDNHMATATLRQKSFYYIWLLGVIKDQKPFLFLFSQCFTAFTIAFWSGESF